MVDQTILVLDNDRRNLFLTRQALTDQGYDVLIAASIPKAERLLTQTGAIAAVIHLELSEDEYDKNGWETWEFVSSLPENVSLIIVTDYPSKIPTNILKENIHLFLRSYPDQLETLLEEIERVTSQSPRSFASLPIADTTPREKKGKKERKESGGSIPTLPGTSARPDSSTPGAGNLEREVEKIAGPDITQHGIDQRMAGDSTTDAPMPKDKKKKKRGKGK